jgi:hypothetical protein
MENRYNLRHLVLGNPNHVFFPFLVYAVVNLAGYLKVKAAMGLAGLTGERHTRFFGGTVTFSNVTVHTGGYHIFPAIAAASGTRNNVVKGKSLTIVATVLAGMIISLKEVTTS